ncbi:GntR family transcriptional regulator [Roseivivax isoporae]|uniref:Transcriptional regulator n=1 Tax=Roseivivax isoporae LMG 25204 TaxID=1449351 RepID=X7FD59_9RHOB|nr:GntR family transcriptional regulator [Roseivivax isoporae]ETX30852.1 transcriptional regulator [Roseivivax isoporae LMG 25204]
MSPSETSTDTPQTEVYNRIWRAIADRKMRPGTRLKEEQLAEIFSVSRARIRHALTALQHDGLVTIVPHRGAFVAQPSIEEARDIFFARRTIETQLAARLCAAATPDTVARLERHVQSERAALAAGDTRTAIRLSGGFHLLVGELAGSPYLWEVLRDLVSRTSLIIAMYQVRTGTDCGPDEHAEIVAAITRGDAARATDLMVHHLEHLEGSLDLDQDSIAGGDLKDILL